MDLMAIDTSAQYAPIEGGWERQRLLSTHDFIQTTQPGRRI